MISPAVSAKDELSPGGNRGLNPQHHPGFAGGAGEAIGLAATGAGLATAGVAAGLAAGFGPAAAAGVLAPAWTTCLGPAGGSGWPFLSNSGGRWPAAAAAMAASSAGSHS